MHRIAIASALLLALISFASASEPAYVGTWAKDKAQCAVPQEQEGAPMVFSNKGYDQHETHCMFKSVIGEGSVWKISAVCSVQGDTQDLNFSLSLDGEHLMMSDERGPQVLVRCNEPTRP